VASPGACRRHCGPLAGLLIVAALLPGCVDSVSQKDFRAQADARCSQFRRQSDGLLDPQRATGVPSARNLRKLRSLILRTARELRALEPPLGDADQVGRYIDSVEINAANVGRLAGAVQHRQRASIAELTERVVAGTAATRELAVRYGFEVCGAE
jgi:hypothetical protein